MALLTRLNMRRRRLAWLLIFAGLVLGVASFVIAAVVPSVSPWPWLLLGLVLTVAGIIVLESRTATGRDQRDV
jgi:uncharacterized membrane protein HdeD (DUF308 family)